MRSIFNQPDPDKWIKIANLCLLTVSLGSQHLTLGTFQSILFCTCSRTLGALSSASRFIIDGVCVQKGREQAQFYGFIGVWLSSILLVSHSNSQHDYLVILIRLPSSVLLCLVPLGWTERFPHWWLVLNNQIKHVTWMHSDKLYQTDKQKTPLAIRQKPSDICCPFE